MSRLPIVAARAEAATSGDPTDAGAGPRPDLRDEDIHAVLLAFYDAVEKDPLLAPYFAGIDMPAHIPRIADFWSTLLFHTGRYSGNAFRPHLDMPGLTTEHFAHWLATLERTVDAMHAGPKAELMKELGHRVAFSMQMRLGIAPGEEYRADMP
jgi:hemoglobin